MLFHDALNVLATNANDPFMILVRYVERNRSGHFLFHKSHALLHRVMVRRDNIYVEVILPETIEDDLDVT